MHQALKLEPHRDRGRPRGRPRPTGARASPAIGEPALRVRAGEYALPPVRPPLGAPPDNLHARQPPLQLEVRPPHPLLVAPPSHALPSVDAALRTPPSLATAGARSSAPAFTSAPGRPALVSGGWGIYALPPPSRCLHPLRSQSTWTAALASAHHATRTRTSYPTAPDTASVSPSSIASPSSSSAPSGPT